jgi:cobalt-zinc-cadmium resistance protein CzcA
MKHIKSLSIVVLLLTLAGKSQAQEIKKTLQECIAITLDSNLTMQSGKIAVERAKALQGTAFNIDKTQISLSQDPTSGGGPDNSLSLNQNFDFPTVYTSRRSLMKAETALERSHLEVTRNELVKEISSLYYQLLYVRENINILREQDSIYDKFVFLASAKFETGETGRLEQMNAERLYNENKIALQETEKTYRNVRLALQRMMNTDEWIEPAEPALTIMVIDYSADRFNPRQTPLNRVFENKRAVSEKNLKALKQEFLPGFNFALRSQYLLKSFNPYNITRERFPGGNFTGFEIGVSVPLFFGGQRAKTKAAGYEMEMIRIRQEEAVLNISKEYQMVMNDYLKAKNNLDYYQNRGNKQADEIARISQLSYEKGEIGYVEYIQNLKSAAEIHLQYADAINDYNQTVILLNYLQGNK